MYKKLKIHNNKISYIESDLISPYDVPAYYYSYRDRSMGNEWKKMVFTKCISSDLN